MEDGITKLISNASKNSVLVPLTIKKTKRSQDGSIKASESKKKKQAAKLQNDIVILIMSCHPEGYWESNKIVFDRIKEKFAKINKKIDHETKRLHLDLKTYNFLVYMIFSKARFVICSDINPKAVFSSISHLSEDINNEYLKKSIKNPEYQGLKTFADEKIDIINMIQKIEDWEKGLLFQYESFQRKLHEKKHPISEIVDLIDNNDLLCFSYDFIKVKMNDNENTRNGKYRCKWTDKKLNINEDVMLFKMICSNEDNSNVKNHYFYLSYCKEGIPVIYAYFLISIIEYRFITRKIFYNIINWKRIYSQLGEKIAPIVKFNQFIQNKSSQSIQLMIMDFLVVEKIFNSLLLPLIK